MDKQLLLSAEVQEFIKKHESDDLNALLLQRDKFSSLPISDIVDQIKAKKKAKVKMPTWYKTEGILYPKPVSIEQSSSEQTAKWKAKYIGPGKTGVDLTGGFGVDSYAFADFYQEWIHVEPNRALQQIVEHNAGQLYKSNIKFQNTKAEEFLKTLENPVDLIYIDPDRRPREGRVIGFTDSSPDIIGLLGRLKVTAKFVLVKASPMIDIGAGIKELGSVKEVVVLGINNEVKEVLFKIDFQYVRPKIIRCINLTKDHDDVFNYELLNKSQEVIKTSELSSYLYEPNATILKASGQDTLAIEFELKKLSQNTNLFTSTTLVKNYPGRVFNVIGVENYNRKAIASYLDDGKANLSTRNFIDSPEQMKKKLGIADGGDVYLFGYRDLHQKNKVAVCRKAR